MEYVFLIFITFLLNVRYSVAIAIDPNGAKDGSLEKKFDVLVENVKFLKAELKEQKALIDAQNDRMKSLESIIEKQNERIDTLETNIDEQKDMTEFIETLTDSVAEIVKERNAQTKRLELLENVVKEETSVTKDTTKQLQWLRDTVMKHSSLIDEGHESIRQLGAEISAAMENCTCSMKIAATRPETDNQMKGNDGREDVHTDFLRKDSLEEEPKTTPLDLVRRLTSEQTQKVAFTVCLDRTVSHLRQGQRIPFNKVLLNDGSAFNVQTGAFLCPHTGVYLFTFNINSYAKGEIDAKLVIDGKNQLDAVASAGTGAYEMSANTAVLRVTAGQAVWVANHWISDITLVNTDNFRYTSFSGVLLYSN